VTPIQRWSAKRKRISLALIMSAPEMEMPGLYTNRADTRGVIPGPVPGIPVHEALGYSKIPRDAGTGILGTRPPALPENDDGVGQAASFFFAFLTLLMAKLRFRRDRWSMNSVPCRWSISCWMHTAYMPSAHSSTCSPL